MIEIRTRLRGRVEQVGERVEKAVQAAPQVIGKYMVMEVQGPGSNWPVRTGLSKASFGHRIAGDRVVLTNSQDYAEHIENRTGAAQDAIEQGLERITEQVSIEIQEVLDA